MFPAQEGRKRSVAGNAVGLKALDSEKYFVGLVATAKLSEYSLQMFDEKRWTTAGTFGHVCGINPRVIQDNVFTARVLKPMLPGCAKPADHKDANKFRRLFLKCQFMIEQDARTTHDSHPNEIVATISAIELHVARN